MKKNVSCCDTCGVFVRRLGRHQRRAHPQNTATSGSAPSAPPPAEVDQTPRPLVIDTDASSPELGRSPAIELGEEPAVTDVRAVPVARTNRDNLFDHRTAEASTQADGPPYAPARIRRQLFTRRHRFREYPEFREDVERLDLSPGEQQYSLELDGHRQRRLCDCQKCIRHALRLTGRSPPAEPPPVPGLWITQLPGVELPPATSDDRRELLRRLAQHPDQSLVVCSCVQCSLHRNLMHAWNRVHRHHRRYDSPR